MIQTRFASIDSRISAIIPAVLMLLLASALLTAYPQQEVEPAQDGITVGTVYTSLSTGYYFEGVYYQCLDQAMQRSLSELAQTRGFGLLEMDVGIRPYQIREAVRALIDRGAGGIVLCLQRPTGAAQAVNIAHKAGVPIVIKGVASLLDIPAPFVGDNVQETGETLGEETAGVFQRHFPGQAAHIMIANTRTLEQNRHLEEAFVRGFSRIIPEPQVIDVADDNGSVLNTQELIRLELLDNPQANVFFGTSDLRTEGILLALQQSGRGTLDTEIVASAGGTEDAMQRLLEPEGPWKVEAGYSITGQAEAALRILSGMVQGDIAIDTREEVLVESVILSEPTLTEVETYLREHQSVEDFTPR